MICAHWLGPFMFEFKVFLWLVYSNIWFEVNGIKSSGPVWVKIGNNYAVNQHFFMVHYFFMLSSSRLAFWALTSLPHKAFTICLDGWNRSNKDVQGAFDMAYLGSMQDACQYEPSKYALARHESPSSSVNRVSDQYSRTEGYGFNFHWGLTLT